MFVLLTVPVFSTIVAANYVTSQSIARESAAKLVERFRVEAIESIQDAIHPVDSLVHNAAVLGAVQPAFYARDESSHYLLSMLRHSRTIIATYVGLADGSFRQVRRLSGEFKINGDAPPEGAKFAFRRIDPSSKSAPSIARYTFLDKAGKELGTAEEPTRYDPRQRYWYEQAADKGALIVSDPQVFSVLDLIGFTVAAPFYSGGAIAVSRRGGYIARRVFQIPLHPQDQPGHPQLHPRQERGGHRQFRARPDLRQRQRPGRAATHHLVGR